MVGIAYFIYDVMVLKRNEMMISDAAQTNAVVNDIIPDYLRERLMQQRADQNKGQKKLGTLKEFLHDSAMQPKHTLNTPLADLFLEATVLMADIVGFTAWSSVSDNKRIVLLSLHFTPLGLYAVSHQLTSIFDRLYRRFVNQRKFLTCWKRYTNPLIGK